MAPQAFETLIEVEFTDRTSEEFFYQQPMTEPEVHDTIDALMGELKEFSSPIHVSHWNGGKIYSQEIRLLSPTE